MKILEKNKNLGFTLVEILFSVSVVLIFLGITLGAYLQMKKSVEVSKDAEYVSFLLSKARSDTLASRDNSQFGMHFETSRVVSFSGNEYVEGSVENEVFNLTPGVVIDIISLSGGGDDVIYNRIDGTTDQFGFVRLVNSSSGINKRINISKNGGTSIQ